MKKKMIAFGLVLASALSVLAAPDDSKLEVSSLSISTHDQTDVFTGNAVAVMSDIKVYSDKIVFDRRSGLLTFIGDVKIEMSDGDFTGTDVTIDTKKKILTIRTATIPIEE